MILEADASVRKRLQRGEGGCRNMELVLLFLSFTYFLFIVLFSQFVFKRDETSESHTWILDRPLGWLSQ